MAAYRGVFRTWLNIYNGAFLATGQLLLIIAVSIAVKGEFTN